ncbi:galactose mutarotase-like protein [Ceratobasidium sp. AG-Ba]|nr:galactose mutarotase-like protein [Ceratobasidium sp. AG-Ba]
MDLLQPSSSGVGASLTELWVKDKYGKLRDVVLGYDNRVRNTIKIAVMRTFFVAFTLAWLCKGTRGQVPGQISDPFKQYTITAPDGSITAKFIGSGASLTELWVKDKYGKLRDVVLGYDNRTDPMHPVFNSIVGRYANRIKNAYLSQESESKLPRHLNDHDGLATIHGGKVGWDRRNWTFSGSSGSSITFTHLDPGDENFPGNVTAKVTYHVSHGGKFDISVVATATEKTPIMTTSHIYWNLDAFQDGNKDIFGHRLRIAASRTLEEDSISIPTGNFTQVKGTALDFRKEMAVGARWNQTVGYGGCPVCIGYDLPWIFDKSNRNAPDVSLYSPTSGIKQVLFMCMKEAFTDIEALRLEITTNQPAVQIFSGNWLQIPRKVVHGGPLMIYDQYSAIAIEPEGYLDAINNPEWGVDQICKLLSHQLLVAF